MRPLKILVFLLALVAASAQLARHVYVRWVEDRSSVLQRHERPVKTVIREATSLQALEKRYAAELKRARIEAVANAAKRRAEDPDYDPEAAARADSQVSALRDAIQDWERKTNEIRELWYFWSFGLAALLIGAWSHRRGHSWLGMAFYVLAFAEMRWTSPSFFGGAEQEFTRLLDHKIGFTSLSLLLLFATWRWGNLNPARDARGGAA
jgi:hypothetical protein